MAKSTPVHSVTLKPAKVAELGLRPEQEHVVKVLGSGIGIVVEPRWSPLCGELLVMEQFHTLPGIAAALAALLNREALEQPEVTRLSLVMDDVAARLRQLQPDEAVATLGATALGVAGSLTGVRDPRKRRAAALANQIATVTPGFRHQTAAAQNAGAASQALKEREAAIAKILQISKQRAKEIRGWLEAYTRTANEQAALLASSHQLDSVAARHQFFAAMAGRRHLKPWGYAWHLNGLMLGRGHQLNDAGYATRLRECIVFEGSVFWITQILNRLTLDSYEAIDKHSQQLLAEIDRRIRLLAGFEPLDPYASLIEYLRTELRAAYRCLSASQAANDTLAQAAREHAARAAFKLRYREPHNPHWYPQPH